MELKWIVYITYIVIIVGCILPILWCCATKFINREHHIFIKRRRSNMVKILGWIAIILVTVISPLLLICLEEIVAVAPYIHSFIASLMFVFLYLLCLRYFLLYFDCCYQKDIISWKWLLIVIDSKHTISKYELPWTLKYAKILQNWQLLTVITICFAMFMNIGTSYVVLSVCFLFLTASHLMFVLCVVCFASDR